MFQDLVHRFARNKDFYAGLLLILIGLVSAFLAPGYGIGTPARMGPGFFPLALGVILILMGIAVIVIGQTQVEEEEEDLLSVLPEKIEWRGWLCVLGGPIAFVALGETFGLMPAAFACVFISAMGDKTARPLEAAILALCVSVCGALLFSYLMRVPLPMFDWRM